MTNNRKLNGPSSWQRSTTRNGKMAKHLPNTNVWVLCNKDSETKDIDKIELLKYHRTTFAIKCEIKY